MLRFLSCLFAINCSIICYAQENYNLGARNSGMAGSSITLNDAFSPINNVGAIGNIENSTGAITYQNRYNIPEFMVVGCSFAHTTSLINSGLNFYRYGNDLYSEQKLGLAIGHKIQMMSLGAGINLIQQRIEGLGVWKYWVIEFGGVALLSKQLRIAAHIFNINISNSIPIIMKAGVSYRPIESFMINLETQKSLEGSATIITGIEYQIIDQIALRTGFSTRPFKSAFGVGFAIKKFGLNYSLSNQTDIGSVHEVSVELSFKSK